MTSLSLEQLLEQEERLRFTKFDADDAWNIGSAIRERFLIARKEGKNRYGVDGRGIVISISTFTDHTLFTSAVGEGATTSPDNALWLQGKKNTVRRLHHSSYYCGRKANESQKNLEALGMKFPEYAVVGGAFPILIKGVFVPLGCIIVSGLSQEQDHQMVVDALEEYLK